MAALNQVDLGIPAIEFCILCPNHCRGPRAITANELHSSRGDAHSLKSSIPISEHKLRANGVFSKTKVSSSPNIPKEVKSNGAASNLSSNKINVITNSQVRSKGRLKTKSSSWNKRIEAVCSHLRSKKTANKKQEITQSDSNRREARTSLYVSGQVGIQLNGHDNRSCSPRPPSPKAAFQAANRHSSTCNAPSEVIITDAQSGTRVMVSCQSYCAGPVGTTGLKSEESTSRNASRSINRNENHRSHVDTSSDGYKDHRISEGVRTVGYEEPKSKSGYDELRRQENPSFMKNGPPSVRQCKRRASQIPVLQTGTTRNKEKPVMPAPDMPKAPLSWAEYSRKRQILNERILKSQSGPVRRTASFQTNTTRIETSDDMNGATKSWDYTNTWPVKNSVNSVENVVEMSYQTQLDRPKSSLSLNEESSNYISGIHQTQNGSHMQDRARNHCLSHNLPLSQSCRSLSNEATGDRGGSPVQDRVSNHYLSHNLPMSQSCRSLSSEATGDRAGSPAQESLSHHYLSMHNLPLSRSCRSLRNEATGDQDGASVSYHVKPNLVHGTNHVSLVPHHKKAEKLQSTYQVKTSPATLNGICVTDDKQADFVHDDHPNDLPWNRKSIRPCVRSMEAASGNCQQGLDISTCATIKRSGDDTFDKLANGKDGHLSVVNLDSTDDSIVSGRLTSWMSSPRNSSVMPEHKYHPIVHNGYNQPCPQKRTKPGITEPASPSSVPDQPLANHAHMHVASTSTKIMTQPPNYTRPTVRVFVPGKSEEKAVVYKPVVNAAGNSSRALCEATPEVLSTVTGKHDTEHSTYDLATSPHGLGLQAGPPICTTISSEIQLNDTLLRAQIEGASTPRGGYLGEINGNGNIDTVSNTGKAFSTSELYVKSVNTCDMSRARGSQMLRQEKNVTEYASSSNLHGQSAKVSENINKLSGEHSDGYGPVTKVTSQLFIGNTKPKCKFTKEGVTLCESMPHDTKMSAVHDSKSPVQSDCHDNGAVLPSSVISDRDDSLMTKEEPWDECDGLSNQTEVYVSEEEGLVWDMLTPTTQTIDEIKYNSDVKTISQNKEHLQNEIICDTQESVKSIIEKLMARGLKRDNEISEKDNLVDGSGIRSDDKGESKDFILKKDNLVDGNDIRSEDKGESKDFRDLLQTFKVRENYMNSYGANKLAGLNISPQVPPHTMPTIIITDLVSSSSSSDMTSPLSYGTPSLTSEGETMSQFSDDLTEVGSQISSPLGDVLSGSQTISSLSESAVSLDGNEMHAAERKLASPLSDGMPVSVSPVSPVTHGLSVLVSPVTLVTHGLSAAECQTMSSLSDDTSLSVSPVTPVNHGLSAAECQTMSPLSDGMPASVSSVTTVTHGLPVSVSPVTPVTHGLSVSPVTHGLSVSVSPVTPVTHGLSASVSPVTAVTHGLSAAECQTMSPLSDGTSAPASPVTPVTHGLSAAECQTVSPLSDGMPASVSPVSPVTYGQSAAECQTMSPLNDESPASLSTVSHKLLWQTPLQSNPESLPSNLSTIEKSGHDNIDRIAGVMAKVTTEDKSPINTQDTVSGHVSHSDTVSVSHIVKQISSVQGLGETNNRKPSGSNPMPNNDLTQCSGDQKTQCWQIQNSHWNGGRSESETIHGCFTNATNVNNCNGDGIMRNKDASLDDDRISSDECCVEMGKDGEDEDAGYVTLYEVEDIQESLLCVSEETLSEGSTISGDTHDGMSTCCMDIDVELASNTQCSHRGINVLVNTGESVEEPAEAQSCEADAYRELVASSSDQELGVKGNTVEQQYEKNGTVEAPEGQEENKILWKMKDDSIEESWEEKTIKELKQGGSIQELCEEKTIKTLKQDEVIEELHEGNIEELKQDEVIEELDEQNIEELKQADTVEKLCEKLPAEEFKQFQIFEGLFEAKTNELKEGEITEKLLKDTTVEEENGLQKDCDKETNIVLWGKRTIEKVSLKDCTKGLCDGISQKGDEENTNESSIKISVSDICKRDTGICTRTSLGPLGVITDRYDVNQNYLDKQESNSRLGPKVRPKPRFTKFNEAFKLFSDIEKLGASVGQKPWVPVNPVASRSEDGISQSKLAPESAILNIINADRGADSGTNHQQVDSNPDSNVSSAQRWANNGSTVSISMKGTATSDDIHLPEQHCSEMPPLGSNQSGRPGQDSVIPVIIDVPEVTNQGSKSVTPSKSDASREVLVDINSSLSDCDEDWLVIKDLGAEVDHKLTKLSLPPQMKYQLDSQHCDITPPSVVTDGNCIAPLELCESDDTQHQQESSTSEFVNQYECPKSTIKEVANDVSSEEICFTNIGRVSDCKNNDCIETEADVSEYSTFTLGCTDTDGYIVTGKEQLSDSGHVNGSSNGGSVSLPREGTLFKDRTSAAGSGPMPSVNNGVEKDRITSRETNCDIETESDQVYAAMGYHDDEIVCISADNGGHISDDDIDGYITGYDSCHANDIQNISTVSDPEHISDASDFHDISSGHISDASGCYDASSEHISEEISFDSNESDYVSVSGGDGSAAEYISDCHDSILRDAIDPISDVTGGCDHICTDEIKDIPSLVTPEHASSLECCDHSGQLRNNDECGTEQQSSSMEDAGASYHGDTLADIMFDLELEMLAFRVQNHDTSGSTSDVPMSPSRKQLPAIPDLETQQALTNKMAADKKPTSPKGNSSYGPFFLEYSLLAEYNQLQKQKLPGVYVIPSAKSALFWNGILFVRAGMYQEGVFRFSLLIPDNYPNGDCPRLIFEPPVFHPVVDPVTGELDVKRAFLKWRRNVNHIWQVLLYARRIFYKIDTKSPLNEEAAKLYEQDSEAYKAKVAESIKKCKSDLYEPANTEDPHTIQFSEWDPSVHEDFRQQLHTPKASSPSDDRGKNAQTSGLSWIKKGSLQIFSRDESANA